MSEGVKGEPFDACKGYDRPVYVLIDRACGSACESTLEWLKDALDVALARMRRR